MLIKHKYIWILLALFFSNANANDSDEFIREKRKFGAYHAVHTIYSPNDEDKVYLETIEIKKGNKVLFKEEDYGDHYYFGTEFGAGSESRDKDPYSGSNITGNKIPNLVIGNWNGGAHCCFFLHIFELGKELKRLITIEGGSYPPTLVDLDKDKILEIEFYDGAIDYQFACFASSPPGRVVMEYKNGKYQVSKKFMYRKVPSKRKIKKEVVKIIRAFKTPNGPDLPFEFLKLMMDLSYTGHLKLALKIADETWPPKREGLEKFKTDFQKSLYDSTYWPSFNSQL